MRYFPTAVLFGTLINKTSQLQLNFNGDYLPTYGIQKQLTNDETTHQMTVSDSHLKDVKDVQINFSAVVSSNTCDYNTKCPAGTYCIYSQCQQYWGHYQISNPSNIFEGFNVINDAYGKQNRHITTDPTNSTYRVLEVTYPALSSDPGSLPIGGMGAYMRPVDLFAAQQVALQYQVFFPLGFDFRKGGKLPGLYGGRQFCSGGDPAFDCFSTRKMWRENGDGEVYMYVNKAAQLPNFCTSEMCRDHSHAGYSIGRHTFKFTAGSWTKVRQVVRLNTFTSNGFNADGYIGVYLNGNPNPSMEISNVVFRTNPSVEFAGIQFETFFGGNGLDWATPIEQKVYFKGVYLIYF